jgi:hypothetical protein
MARAAWLLFLTFGLCGLALAVWHGLMAGAGSAARAWDWWQTREH